MLFSKVPDQIDVKEAKIHQFQSWLDHNVYSEVSNDGQKYAPTRWVLTEKFNDGKKITKARLVARGFEEKHPGKFFIDSPTCGKKCLQVLISILSNGWEMNSLDGIIQVKQLLTEIHALQRS